MHGEPSFQFLLWSQAERRALKTASDYVVSHSCEHRLRVWPGLRNMADQVHLCDERFKVVDRHVITRMQAATALSQTAYDTWNRFSEQMKASTAIDEPIVSIGPAPESRSDA